MLLPNQENVLSCHDVSSLGYYPENTNREGRFRKIEIVAADHHDRVTARNGYYAIPPEQR